ncbi:MAG: hypothetical protein Q8930_17795 [Bacillota bacterium]|nr:hypothetical protein [Bacillota bacterium]
MSNIQRLEKIIGEKKWIRNDIGMGRIQCSKAMLINGELLLLICSEVNHKPVWARVEKILVANDEIILFYDGEYCEELDYDEYAEYEEYVSKEEWKVLFEDENTTKLDAQGLISSTDGFYVDVHENIGGYEGEFDEMESENLDLHFDL